MSYEEDQLQLLVNGVEDVLVHCDDLHVTHYELHHVLHPHYFHCAAPCEDQNVAHRDYEGHRVGLHEDHHEGHRVDLHVALHEDLHEDLHVGLHVGLHEDHHVVLNVVHHEVQNGDPNEAAPNVEPNDGRGAREKDDHGVGLVLGDVQDDTESGEGQCEEGALLEVEEVHLDDGEEVPDDEQLEVHDDDVVGDDDKEC